MRGRFLTLNYKFFYIKFIYYFFTLNYKRKCQQRVFMKVSVINIYCPALLIFRNSHACCTLKSTDVQSNVAGNAAMIHI